MESVNRTLVRFPINIFNKLLKIRLIKEINEVLSIKSFHKLPDRDRANLTGAVR